MSAILVNDNGATMENRIETKSEQINLIVQLKPLNKQQLQIRIVGDTPLICHRWSEKAIKMILDKQAKKAKTAKEVRNPEEEYRASLYHMEDGSFGFPTVCFKNAAVDACSHIDGITKVLARGAFHPLGELTKIEGTPHMRTDMVRVGMGVADVRYRGEFSTWACNLNVVYNANVLSAEQIVNLVNTAGFTCGVGDWRPSRDGSKGMFHVE